MINIDPNKVADIIREVSAVEIMPRFKNLADGEIREKNPGDFVTVADEASEKALSAALKELLPGSLVVGEEAVAKDKSVLQQLETDKPVWIIDPIDGTYNFAHGRSKFGVLVALARNSVTEYGWCYDAPGDRMAIAVKGGGVTINGTPTKMRKEATQPSEMVGMGGGAQPWHFDPVRPQVKELLNVRSSLHDFLALAAGEADYVMHVGSVTPWDHAATVLMAEEAGAYVRFSDTGKSFTPNMIGPSMLLAAADEAKWKMLQSIFYPAMLKKSA